jgi:lipopolysaccharide/colanic/teichoic acid biosynthesis glycosyltransferase
MTLPGTSKKAKVKDTFFEAIATAERDVLKEDSFRRMIAIERKRTERSREPFLLMLLEDGNYQGGGTSSRTLDGIMRAMLSCTRETDVVGWYRDVNTIGVMFTGLVISEKSAVLSTILSRVSLALREEMSTEQFNQISISVHFFPDDWDGGDSGRPSDPVLYPDLLSPKEEVKSLLRVKRAMDVAGSSLMLLLCLPLFLLIAVAIKLTSKGPVLFRQARIGQYGRHFTFLKFRSMRVGNDASVHREYVTKLIAGEAERIQSSSGEGVYKLANDKRVTPVGGFLRKTSLDELPQFLNVLLGDMSLVGPRPPLPYELAAYQTWHRRRVLQVKPGITGLWQVTGRSRVRFDDMVRLDLRYAMSWSPMLDLKILLRTPGAVIKGAY